MSKGNDSNTTSIQSSTQPSELIRLSQDYIREYRESKDRDLLSSADESVSLALQNDPDFVLAHYYKGIVQDLLGNAQGAVASFETVIREHAEVIADAEYNLAVAYYHCYGHPNLRKAERHFLAVIDRTAGSRQRALNLLARAGLAQTYAMLMVPSLRGLTDEQIEDFLKKEDLKKTVAEYYAKSKEESDRVVSELSRRRGIGKALEEIGWIIHNTRAISEMFYTDFWNDDRIARLQKGLQELDEANCLSPDNWSIYCNYGSTHMRLAHWIEAGEGAGRSDVHFNKAETYLRRVVEVLLPDYGFAFYEIGRVLRLRGSFLEAIGFFAKAATIPEADRVVSNERLRLETSRAQKYSTVYP